MKLIVTSTQDVASANITHLIMDSYKLEKTNETFEEFPIYRQTVNGEEVKLSRPAANPSAPNSSQTTSLPVC